jgi:hypothetical protein
MSMQATRTIGPEVETPVSVEAAGGTFQREKSTDVVARAHELALDIERLLTPSPEDQEPYGRRLARALTRSLIDQLADLQREKARAKLL